MTRVTARQAREQFSDLLDRVEKGDTVEVTRRGKAVVRLVAVPKRAKGLRDLPAFRATVQVRGTPTSKVVEQMRDEQRF